MLASTLTYTGFLVVGVLAHYLDIGRVMAGLLLGVLFARVPWFSKGKLRTYGLLPAPLRRPAMVLLLVLSLAHFLWLGDYLPAVVIAFAAFFLVAFPWIRRAIWGRIVSSLFKSAPGPGRQKDRDDMVIDGEFREKKD
ncbi:hypothetical protein KY495_05500 [Massilia sp. PAMC28688]|uniref:hypothetical protein n=1 Tax=Massilia sp. PAMC28688 TaxID=2861283 RepID=UPI001C62DC46|nr:hypothetical protein [Massilia sp. PAMC28688]QYF94652.1 hypothetical protein KY495_05500 [Massilia sp. PAMC28688]